MKYLAALSFIASSCIATAAFAGGQDSEWYTGLSGDISFPRDTSVTGTTSGDIKYKFSSGGNISLGYRPNALNNSTGDARFELEGGYHAFGLKSITANGVTNANPSGDLKAFTLMGNAYYDLHTGTPFTPYIGAGIGDADINFDKSNGFGMTKSNSNQLGYQFMTGVSYTPESLPQTEWSLGYRYLGTTSPQFATTTGDVKFDPIRASNVELGFKYHF